MRLPWALALVVAMTTATAADPKPATDWAARAKAVTWSLSPDATVLHFLRNVTGYDVALVHSGTKGSFSHLTIRIESRGKKLYAWTGHHESPFVIAGDTLYYADYSPIASGATLVAVDLKKKKERWRTRLQAIGMQSHSQYRNRLHLEVSDVVTVQGEEANGSYVELVDLATGQTLANEARKSSP